MEEHGEIVDEMENRTSLLLLDRVSQLSCRFRALASAPVRSLLRNLNSDLAIIRKGGR